ncbi:tetratricopeptide repeat protein (macronuclear) [Tetrahymena thermophila SB210]|uniref:Tetratricopeptide repeat protein n=1 Tax=Tetrahymena thermophila (strain SB210) TaxID=312017 RepID=Q22KX7_TETTS|nr:tetratricopeptide repeat protein [Tetrahymena thermophila SB210]EAR85907.2 tetratricopeptide repeat protein [Tetrahymena thermophila SB210]|eukprot:XP_976502.2 tetratricopeptide repeat protein [Tetrahymena thermophila SB210]
MGYEIILLASIPVVVAFMSSIIAQQIALYYTKQMVNQYTDNLFENQIMLSSLSTQILSYRLSKEVYKFPVYLQQINSYYLKIIQGKVKYNPNHIQALTNIFLLYNQKEDPVLTTMSLKNPFLVNSWYVKSKTEISQLDPLEKISLFNSSYLSPLIKTIGYYNQFKFSNLSVQTIPYQQVILGTSQSGLLFSNFLNSSLKVSDQPSDNSDLFSYDPRQRFWYLNTLNQTSFFMNPPEISVGMVTPYLSQFACEKLLFYNEQTKQEEVHHVQCIEAMLSNLQYFFQNVIYSSKQYYIIDPRTLSVVYDSNKQQQYSTQSSIDNFYDVELKYLQNQAEAQSFLDLINIKYNKWVYQTTENYTSIEQMIDLSYQHDIFDYQRNQSLYKVIINPIIGYDDIPKYLIKNSINHTQQLEYVYLQINILSDEDLRAQGDKLITFSYNLFLGIEIAIGVFSLFFIIATVYYIKQIKNLIYQPIIHLTRILKQIDQLNRMVEISDIILECGRNADEIFLSFETNMLYTSFYELFQLIQYTSENFYVENEGRTLINLSKRVDFFKKFGNYYAVGIIHNNIGNILLNQQHYFQALENFSLSIMYSKYEIQQSLIQNPQLLSFHELQTYCFKDIIEIQSTNSYCQKYLNNQENQIHLKSTERKKKTLSNQAKKSEYSKTNNMNTQDSQAEQNLKKQVITIQAIQNKEQRCYSGFKEYVEQNEENEDINQIIEQIESLCFRQFNYISTLIAFQEDLDHKKHEFNHFNFWPEIKNLVQHLLRQSDLLPQKQNLQVLCYCVISKCYFRLFQNSKAEYKLQKVQQILKYIQIKSKEDDLSIRQKNKSEIQQQKILKKMSSALINDHINQIKAKSPFKSTKRFFAQTPIKQHRKTSIQQLCDQNKANANNSPFSHSPQNKPFFSKKKIKIENEIESQPISNFRRNSFKKNEMNSFNLVKKKDGSKGQISSSQLTKDLQNLMNKKKKSSLINLTYEILAQYFQFTYAEFLLFKNKYKSSSLVLTQMLEKNKNLMSHMPFKIVYKLNQIFRHFHIQDKFLCEEYSRFNNQTQIQIVISLEASTQESDQYFSKNIDEDYDQSKQNDFIILNELIKNVLTNQNDKLAISIIKKEEKCVQQYMELINIQQIKLSLEQLFYELSWQTSQNFFHYNQIFKTLEISNYYEKQDIQISQQNHSFQIFNTSQENIYSNNQREFMEFSKMNQTRFYEKYMFITQINHLNNQNYKNQENSNNLLNQNNTSVGQIQNLKKSEIDLKTDFVQCQDFNQTQEEYDSGIKLNLQIQTNIRNQLTSEISNLQKYIDNQSVSLNISNSQINVGALYEKNGLFHHFVRQALIQLINKQINYKYIEHLYNKNNKKPQKIDQNEHFFNKKQLKALRQKQTLKFIVYLTEQICLIQNDLFRSLCEILAEFNIQILIIAHKKGTNFLEQSQNQTYCFQDKELIKVFYEVTKLNSYISFQRNQFTKYTYMSFIQKF